MHKVVISHTPPSTAEELPPLVQAVELRCSASDLTCTLGMQCNEVIFLHLDQHTALQQCVYINSLHISFLSQR